MLFMYLFIAKKLFRFWGLNNASGATQEYDILPGVFDVGFLSEILENILRHSHCALLDILEGFSFFLFVCCGLVWFVFCL